MAQPASAGNANRRLIQPLGGVVTAGFALAAVVVAGNLVMAVLRAFGVTAPEPDSQCASLPLNGIAMIASGDSGYLAHPRPGVYGGPADQVNACVNHPTIGQHVLVTLTTAPRLILLLAILALLYRLLRTIETGGPFAVLVARRLRFLGWFVLAGALVMTAVQSTAQGLFDSTVVTDHVPVAANVTSAEINAVPLPLLIACGLLTIARVIRAGTQMSDELAVTV